MKKIIATICAVMIAFCGLIAIPAGNAWAVNPQECRDWYNSAADSPCKKQCVETSSLGEEVEQNDGKKIRLKCDDGKGGGIKSVLKLVIDILSICVGVLGVTAIVVVGINYLTAGPDVSRTVKAKVRIMQIVIGLVIYALIYALLNFLIPDFNGSSDSQAYINETTSIVAEK